jgi:hypothetical protein
MNCPKCGLINTGNLAVGLAMPQCMCQWQNTQEKCRIETVPAQGTLLPKREWVGLTDEEFHEACWESYVDPVTGECSTGDREYAVRWTEAKLKEKNT